MIKTPAVCKRCAAAPPEPSNGFCGACLVCMAEDGRRFEERLWQASQPLHEAFPGLPRAKYVRKPPRVCERCGGPGGRRYAGDGLCGPCREDLAAKRDERLRTGG